MENKKPLKTSSHAGTTAVKKKGKMSTGTMIIMGAAAVLVIIALVLGGLVLRKYANVNKDIEEAKELYTPTAPTDKDNGDTPPEIDVETGVVLDFKKLYETNSDVRGWISIPDTQLTQVVMQGVDNSFYLNRNYKKEKSALGAPFIDYRAFLSDAHQSTNLTIYGHAAKNGTHFAAVKDYKDVSFYKEHPVIDFNTIYGNGKYKIIGFFMEDVSIDNTKMFNYHDQVELDEAGFKKFISEMEKRSYFNTGVDVEYGDHLISLSTCDEDIVKGTSTPFRSVLVARKVREGETADVDTSKATINKQMVMPDKWVTKMGKANPYQ